MSEGKNIIEKILSSKFTHLALLFIVVLLCYLRTLGSYFLADDFGEIRYVARIAEGDWGRFWSNFTGNFMQIHTMAVYRPWLLITLVVDYFIWGTNAFGYYLSNYAHYLACVVLIYFFVSGLTQYWGAKRSGACAFFSALLFAVSPLHPESVSWVVGRVDIVCLAWFMGSLVAMQKYLKQDKTSFLIIACVCFWIAILTKEMAIGLPVLAVAMSFLWGDKQKLKKVALIFGAFTVIYFIIRYLALGTMGGGYTGSIGSNQLSEILTKWTDTGTLSRIFFPLKISYGGALENVRQMLTKIYLGIFLLVGVRLFIYNWPRKWMLFILVWLGVSLVPIYQLYGLGFDLEGARFLFFATAPLSILVPVLVFAPIKPQNIKSDLVKLNKRIAIGGVVILLVLSANYMSLAMKNNRSWINAGAQTRALGAETKALSEKTPKGQKVCVMGTPSEREGAHMILNAISLLFYLEPPFSKETRENVLSFGSKYYGDENKLDLGFFRFAAASRYPFYKWNWNDKKWVLFPVEPPAAGVPLKALPAGLSVSSDKNVELTIDALNIVPSHYDYLDIDLSETLLKEMKVLGKPAVKLSFKGANDKDRSEVEVLDYIFLPEKIRIPISNYWKWQSAGKIQQIFVHLPLRHIDEGKADLIAYSNAAPEITLNSVQSGKPLAWSNYGTHWVRKDSKYEVAADVSLMPSTQKTQPISVEFQISKPNYFFENLSGGKDSESMVETRIKSQIEAGKVKALIPPEVMDFHGFRQVRARCFDASGVAIESYSYPLTLENVTESSD